MKYSQARIALLTFAVGLAGVLFLNALSERWSEIEVDLPQVRSGAPLLVYARNPPFYKRFTAKDLTENRDLSLYDRGGEFSNCFNHGFDDSEFRACQNQTAAARNFIFKHFREKKRGHLVYEFSGCDSGSETHIFIEPDERGKWHIVSRSAGDFRYQSLSQTKGYSVKYRSATEDDYPLKTGTRLLAIFDESGEEIENF